MNNAAILVLIVFSMIASTFTYVIYKNYQERCDVSGGFAGKTVKTCVCAGVKVSIKSDPKARDAYQENFCVGFQAPSTAINY